MTEGEALKQSKSYPFIREITLERGPVPERKLLPEITFSPENLSVWQSKICYCLLFVYDEIQLIYNISVSGIPCNASLFVYIVK